MLPLLRRRLGRPSERPHVLQVGRGAKEQLTMRAERHAREPVGRHAHEVRLVLLLLVVHLRRALLVRRREGLWTSPPLLRLWGTVGEKRRHAFR